MVGSNQFIVGRFVGGLQPEHQPSVLRGRLSRPAQLVVGYSLVGMKKASPDDPRVLEDLVETSCASNYR